MRGFDESLILGGMTLDSFVLRLFIFEGTIICWRFLDASGLTRQSKYNLFRGAALRHLVSVHAVKQFQHSNPSFCFVVPSPILDKIPAGNSEKLEGVWNVKIRWVQTFA